MSQETSPAQEVSAEAQLEAVFAKRYGEEKPEETEAADDSPEETGDDVAEEPTDEPQDGEKEEKPAETDADEEEIELDGELFKLPKKVKEAVLRQKDYTQKTQELASVRKIAEDRAQFYEASSQLMQQAFQDAANVHALGQQLQQFGQVDWNKLVVEDPQRAMQLSLQRQQLVEAYQQGQTRLQTAAQSIQQARELHRKQQTELGQKELQRRGITMDAKAREQMGSLAQELGFDERDLMSPAAVHALHMAAKYKAVIDAKPAVTKKAATAKPYSAPAARSSQSTTEASKINTMKTQALKSGKPKDVEAFLAARFARNR